MEDSKYGPPFQKGSREQPGNYRSKLSVSEATGKKSVRLKDHLEMKGLIGYDQHGFVMAISCQIDLIEFF